MSVMSRALNERRELAIRLVRWGWVQCADVLVVEVGEERVVRGELVSGELGKMGRRVVRVIVGVVVRVSRGG